MFASRVGHEMQVNMPRYVCTEAVEQDQLGQPLKKKKRANEREQQPAVKCNTANVAQICLRSDDLRRVEFEFR